MVEHQNVHLWNLSQSLVILVLILVFIFVFELFVFVSVLVLGVLFDFVLFVVLYVDIQNQLGELALEPGLSRVALQLPVDFFDQLYKMIVVHQLLRLNVEKVARVHLE